MSLHKQLPLIGIIAMCVALGVVIAASVNLWTSEAEAGGHGVLAICAAALALASAGAIPLYFRLMQSSQPGAHGTQQHLATIALQREPAGGKDHDHMRALLGTTDIGILFLSMNERAVYSNAAFRRIWQVPPGLDLAGMSVEGLRLAIDGALVRPAEQSRSLLRAPSGNDVQLKLDLPMVDGRLITQHSHTVHDSAGSSLGRMWMFEDVTVDRRHASELLKFAERDALTGLYNRRRFNEEIARMTADAQRHSSRLALMFFDLDQLKQINDTFGHRAGDVVLARVASAVGGQVRRNEIFARLGGDEFAILVPDAVDTVLEVLAERVTRAIAQMRVEFEQQQLRVTCSCGIAVYPDGASSPDDLLACADAAMYQAKEAGKNAWRFYRSNTAMTQPAVSPLSPDGRIRDALENNLLVLHYQGIYGAHERRLTHYEVLLRMRDPENPGVLLPPGEFIAMAEKSDRVVDIDRWVLGQAIETLALDSDVPALAVNISGRSLDDPKLLEFIESELKRRGVAPRRLLVELTETSAVSDLHDARHFVDALQSMGCGVSLDDFGTGFSLFAYLKHLQVDSIKIDGLFIRNLPNDRENQLFVQAIVTIARGLNKTTIAECVEDEATLKILRALGVDYVQGYHLEVPHARPTGLRYAPSLVPA